MRDGVRLATDVYPQATDEQAPALVMRLSYEQERIGQPICPCMTAAVI